MFASSSYRLVIFLSFVNKIVEVTISKTYLITKGDISHWFSGRSINTGATSEAILLVNLVLQIVFSVSGVNFVIKIRDMKDETVCLSKLLGP